VLAKILAARVILLLAGAGAFVLAMIALKSPSISGIVTSGLYDVLIFGPSIYFALRKE
jgi:hypothetical protein